MVLSSPGDSRLSINSETGKLLETSTPGAGKRVCACVLTFLAGRTPEAVIALAHDNLS